ncbi:MAG TPA: WD40 repeat domain-containing protein [Abditibacteriaceae bacterium]|jgi:WD40 repeat protein
MKLRPTRLSRAELFLLITPLLVGALFGTWALRHTLLRSWFSVKLQGSSDALQCLAWSHDGKWLATGGGTRGGTISGRKPLPETAALFIWDAHSGSLRHRLEGPRSVVERLAWSPDDSTLASGSRAGVMAWKASSGARLDYNGVWSFQRYGDLRFSRDGHTVQTQSFSPGKKLVPQQVKLDLRSLAPPSVVATSLRGWPASELSPDGLRYAQISNSSRYLGSRIEIQDANHKRLRTSRGDMFQTLTWRDNTTLRGLAYITAGYKKLSAMLCEMNVQTGRETWLELNSDKPLEAAFSRDASLVAVREAEQIHIYDAATGVELRSVSCGPPEAMQSLAFSPDAKTLAYLEGSAVRLFELK